MSKHANGNYLNKYSWRNKIEVRPIPSKNGGREVQRRN